MRRNPRWVVANRRRRRLRRNQGWLPSWPALVKDVITPIVGASAGFIAARYVGNMLAERDLGTTDPKVASMTTFCTISPPR